MFKHGKRSLILIVCAVIAIASVPIAVVCKKLFLIPLSFAYAAFFAANYLLIGDDLVFFVLTTYFVIAGPIDMLLLEITPINVLGVGYSYSYLFLSNTNRALYYQYFLHSIGMYELLLLSYSFFSRIVFVNRVKTVSLRIKTPIDNRKLLSKYLILVLYSAAVCFLRMTFQLDVPGKLPTISGAGIIVYLYRFVGLVLLYRCVEADLSGEKIQVGSIFVMLLDLIVISFSDILLDRRGPFFYYLLVIAAYLFCVDRESVIAFVKKRKVFIICGAVLLLSVFSVFSAKVRYRGTVSLSPLYLISRIIGIADGFVGLSYKNNVGDAFVKFSLADYFKNVLSLSANSANAVYTHEVLGFPATVQHSSSLPMFVGTFMYDGFLGYLMISVIFGFVFSLAAKRIRAFNRTKNRSDRIQAFVGCHLIVYATARVMGGGSERLIEVLLLPVMLFLYSAVIKVKDTEK